MPTDTSERSLERLICTALAGHPCEPPGSGTVAEPPAGYGGAGWSGGSPHDYDREHCVDVVQLRAFLRETQPDAADPLALDEDGPTRRRFLARLQGEVSKRGTIDVLRHGLRHGAAAPGPLLRNAVARQREGRGTLRTQPFHRYSPAPLQQG